ncbi:MAG TPA: hypothetical protein VMF67_05180 [Rhizomicrobium sp.]|nr:hypothetical protein [Rhizomicrobium sp.]
MTRKNGRLTKLERLALEAFSNGPAEPPKRVTNTLIFSLKQQKWIKIAPREYSFGPERYENLPDGDARLAADKAADKKT